MLFFVIFIAQNMKSIAMNIKKHIFSIEKADFLW